MMRTVLTAISLTAAMLLVATVSIIEVGETSTGPWGRWLIYSAIIVGFPFAWHWLYVSLSGDR